MKKIIIVLMMFALCVGCTQSNNSNDTSKALIVEDGMIKYENNGKVEEVISLEELLSGTNNTSTIEAKEIELFVEDGYIVWNYVGETAVHKLIAVSDLVGKQGTTGPKGDTGAQGAQGATGATGAQGQAGADGTNAYIWVKYLDSDPAQADDIDLQDETGSYMGIYYGTLSSAPNDIASYKWYNIKGEKGDKGDKGDTGEQGEQGIQGPKGDTGEQGIQGIQGDAGKDGTNAYISVRYSNTDPSTDNYATISDVPTNNTTYMGIYAGDDNSNIDDYSKYQWVKIKGEQGEQGIQGPQGNPGQNGSNGSNGTNAYVWIRYSSGNPATDASAIMTATPDENTVYMGVYSGNASNAPDAVSSYNWVKIKGDDGSTSTATSNDYLNNVAIFTYNGSYGETNINDNQFSVSYYIGENLKNEIGMDDNYHYIKLDANNTYLYEINGTIYFKSSNISQFHVNQPLDGSKSNNLLTKNISESERNDFTYYGGFSGIGTIKDVLLLPVNVSANTTNTSFTQTYHFNYTIKIFKQ